MKIRWTGEGNNEGFAMSNNMSVTKEIIIRQVLAAQAGRTVHSVCGECQPGIQLSPYFRKNYFSYGNVRKNYSIVVKADTSDLSAARLSFDLILPDSLFYLDNVNFTE